ncbi:MAG: carboxypeptidase-like regulatory domain-containing protein [Candidatus Riflebacteria bacterium]|nr:carboxypeptidase-like regulatory domain-containing protein [Candidatus Riflebacteria bacterium]
MVVKKQPVWAILVFFALVTLCGCSGGGSQAGSGVVTSSPESAVYEILESWQSSQPSVVSVDGEQPAVRQESTVIPSEERYISFKDMSGELWSLHVTQIVYLSIDIAEVYTSHTSTDANIGSLELIFEMVRESGRWYLEGIRVVEIPVVIVTGTGIKGVLSDESTNLPISGALVELYNQSTGIIAGSTTTDETGFYSILDLSPGTYYLVIEREGFAPQTISGITIS